MLAQSNDYVYDDYFLDLFGKTILRNKYIPYNIKKGILDYPEELRLLYEVNKFKLDPVTDQPEINEVLAGGARFGGKTLMGAVLALQYIEYSSYKALVTRNTYDDLLAKGKDSIWGYIKLWQNELNLNKDEMLDINKHEKTISCPYGGFVSFKAFNYDQKADSLQSKSYKRVISDESPQLSLNIIEDFKPTLRQGIDENFPLSLIHFGNPQLNNPDVNAWFGKTFVKGKYPYINMDLNNNPLINRAAYKQSFKNLPKAKREVFLKGNFFYKAQIGDLIEQSNLDKAVINSDKINYHKTASVLFIDLAGKGKDKFAISTITLLPDGRKLLDNVSQTKTADGTKTVFKHVKEDYERKVYPSLAILEMEGGSWLYTEKFWKSFFNKLNIKVKSSKPVGSKYMRAMPVAEDIISRNLLINEDLRGKYYLEDDNNEDYFTLFSDQMISMVPVMKISPDIVDSVSLGINYLKKVKIKT